MKRIIHLNDNRYEVDDAICDEIVRLKAELEQVKDVNYQCQAERKKAYEEIDRLKAILEDSEKWLKWCDIKVLEMNEQQAERIRGLEETIREKQADIKRIDEARIQALKRGEA